MAGDTGDVTMHLAHDVDDLWATEQAGLDGS